MANSDIWSRGTNADMYDTFEEIGSYISMSETLYSGEFIGFEACSGKMGSGCGLEMGRFLLKGNMLELSVEWIGTLRNTVQGHSGML